MEPKPKLGYWDNRTICEPIRLLLALAEIDYEDVRYPVGGPPTYEKSQWHDEKFTLKLAAPNLPYWIEPGPNGVRITQTQAILLHIAKLKDLAGNTPTRHTLVVMALNVITDWFDAFVKVTYLNVSPATAEPGVHVAGEVQARASSPDFERERTRYLATIMPTHVDNMLRLLAMSEDAAAAAPTGWLVGSPTPTCADVVLFELVDQHLAFAPGALDTDPRLAPLRAHHARVLDLPAISAYRSSARFTPEPFHNLYSQFARGWLPADPWARREVCAPAPEPPPRSAGAAPIDLTIPTTPAGAVFLRRSAEPVDDSRGSLAQRGDKRRNMLRDVGAFVCLGVCLLLLVLIGRTAISFSPEQEAETEFVTVGPVEASTSE